MSRLLFLVALAICPASAQVSNPVATDADLEPNSYRDSSPIAVEEVRVFSVHSTRRSVRMLCRSFLGNVLATPLMAASWIFDCGGSPRCGLMPLHSWEC